MAESLFNNGHRVLGAALTGAPRANPLTRMAARVCTTTNNRVWTAS